MLRLCAAGISICGCPEYDWHVSVDAKRDVVIVTVSGDNVHTLC